MSSSLCFSCGGGSSLSLFGAWCGCHMLRCYVQQMLVHESPKLSHLFRNTIVSVYIFVEVGMYALYALFSKKSESHMPLPQPGNHVLFKHVHFGEDSGMWELFAVISHELLYVNTCWE